MDWTGREKMSGSGRRDRVGWGLQARGRGTEPEGGEAMHVGTESDVDET